MMHYPHYLNNHNNLAFLIIKVQYHQMVAVYILSYEFQKYFLRKFQVEVSHLS